MYHYFIGQVKEKYDGQIVFEVNGIGYLIFVTKRFKYEPDTTMKIYLYHVTREDDEYLIAFNEIGEKELFKNLLNVKGLGPKIAISILSSATPEEIITAIKNENLRFLKSLDSVGPKLASQIILDLKGKLVTATMQSIKDDELYLALVTLGYSNEIACKIALKINETRSGDPISLRIRSALDLIREVK
jgi:Holliday junction DNA helicase RuvA